MSIPQASPNAKLSDTVNGSAEASEPSQYDFSSHSLVLSQDHLSRPTFKEVTTSPIDVNDIELQVEAFSTGLGSNYVEYSGTVISVGANVQGYEVGDRVLAVDTTPCASRPRINVDHVQRLPKDMSFTTAAGLPLAIITAIFAMDLLEGELKKAILLQDVDSMVGQVLFLLSRVIYTDVYVIASDASEKKILTENLQLRPDNVIQADSLRASKPILPEEGLKFDTIVVSDSFEAPSHITSLLRPFGSLVRMKSGSEKTHSSNHQLEAHPNITIRTCDVEAHLRAHPDEVARLLKVAAMWIDKFSSASFGPTIEPISRIRDVLSEQKVNGRGDRVVFEVRQGSTVPAFVG